MTKAEGLYAFVTCLCVPVCALVGRWGCECVGDTLLESTISQEGTLEGFILGI